MLSSQLLEAVFRTVEILPPTSIENVAAAMMYALPPDEWRSRVLASVALPHERVALTALLTVWEKEKGLSAANILATALQSALHTKSAIERTHQIELVWTGPSSGMTFRRTDQALLQVIQSAKRELLLVTFAAYRVPLLRDAIRLAAERGVVISFVSESAEQSRGKVSFDAANALREISDHIKFYVWPHNKRGKDHLGNFGLLHAKCALADAEMLFVSSANLTDSALILNMEMGLLIQGGSLPMQVREHFLRLYDHGYLVPMEF